MTRRKRLSILTVSMLLLLVAVPAVAAHPLGNFTISRYSRITAVPDALHLLYVVDMAEIPTFQERQTMDVNSDDAISSTEQEQYLDQQMSILAQNLHLEINGRPVTWSAPTGSLQFPPGQGDLPTLRLEMTLTAVLPPGTSWQADYRDQNYADRLGWQEIVVSADDGAQLLAASVPTQDVTDALRQYPQDLLAAPLAVHQAQFQFAPAGINAAEVSSTAVSPTDATANRFSQDTFANLLTGALDSPTAVIAALLAAIGLGAAHALTPGHGKTIVGAYLVGSRGTARHALFLGLTTTLTHTAGVFALGFIVLFAARTIVPEQLYPWLGVASGLLVLGIGLSLFRQRLIARHPPTQAHAEAGYHTHFGVAHSHAPVQAGTGWRSLLALGVSGGLIPCPSALILLLSATALGQVGFGLVLILAFSLGLASVLTGIGLMLVYAGRLFTQVPGGYGRFTVWLPVASAFFITLAGLGITVKALAETLG